jgi:hypothetical protein
VRSRRLFSVGSSVGTRYRPGLGWLRTSVPRKSETLPDPDQRVRTNGIRGEAFCCICTYGEPVASDAKANPLRHEEDEHTSAVRTENVMVMHGDSRTTNRYRVIERGRTTGRAGSGGWPGLRRATEQVTQKRRRDRTDRAYRAGWLRRRSLVAWPTAHRPQAAACTAALHLHGTRARESRVRHCARAESGTGVILGVIGSRCNSAGRVSTQPVSLARGS